MQFVYQNKEYFKLRNFNLKKTNQTLARSYSSKEFKLF